MEKKNRILIALTIVSTIIYLIWRTFFTLPYGEGTFSFIWGIILIIFEFFGLLESIIHFKDMYNIEYPKRPKILDEEYPHVDVFIATYNEPVELLYKTVNGCLNMDYPDKEKVHIYICDDNNREEMKVLADHLGVNYITRLDRKGAKAGNYNNALNNTSSPLIVTFDADMIPMHDFLTATVPYFFSKDEKIGFVQTPQSFYNPDLFQFYLYSEGRVPNEQDYFYRDIQVGKNKSNSVIYGGSNTVLSRQALMDVGGFYTKVITEDFATGMLIQSKGYKCIAIDEVHASGLSPADLKSLLKQRDRWARGCIQTAKKLNILFRKGLSIEQKISYISAMTYWYSPLKRLIYILSPILYGVFGVVVVKTTLGQALLIWLPTYILNRVTLRKVSKNIRSVKWTNIYETILFPSLLPSVILETLGISEKSFSVTKKDGVENDAEFRRRAAVPHAIFAVLSVYSILRCVKEVFVSGNIGTSIVLFWLIFNLYTIIMSLFFMLGRRIYRGAERFRIDTECTLSFNDKIIKCRTFDISETGISIILKESEYILHDKWLEITIKDERYKSSFKAMISHVASLDQGFKYAFVIGDISEEDERGLLNIIYDREPDLPKVIEKHNSVFDDIRINVLTRKNKTVSHNRKLPRINIFKSFYTDEKEQVFVKNFNYEYIFLKLNKSRNRLNIIIDEDTILECSIAKEIKEDEKGMTGIFFVVNYRELIDNENFKKKLTIWNNECKINFKEKVMNYYEDEFYENQYI